jgi:DeoR/GlpR family transcriptional regulator of sugar metabolism
MADVSNQVIVMSESESESEKLQRKIPNVELAWGSVSVLVTDDQIPADVKQQIKQQGVDVICANTAKIGA